MNTKNLMPFVGIWVVVLTPVIMIFGVFFSIKNTSGFSSPAPKAVEMSVDSAKKALTLVAQKYNREIYRATNSDRALYNRASVVLEKEHRAKPTVAAVATSALTEGDAAIARTMRSISRVGYQLVEGLVRLIQWVLGFLIVAFLFMLFSNEGVKKETTQTVLTAQSTGVVSPQEKEKRGPKNEHYDASDFRAWKSPLAAAVLSIPGLNFLYRSAHSEEVAAADFHEHLIFFETDLGSSKELMRQNKLKETVVSEMDKVAKTVLENPGGKHGFPISRHELEHLETLLGSVKGSLKRDLQREESNDSGSRETKETLQNSIRRIERYKKDILSPVLRQKKRETNWF